MEKILFIVPPYVSFDSFVNPAFNDGTAMKGGRKYRSIVADIPLGVLSLATYVKKHLEAEVRVLDFNIVLQKLESFDCNSFLDLYKKVLSSPEWTGYAPGLIGISTLFSPSYRNMLELGQVARSLFPKALLLAGGGIPSCMHKEIFAESSSFDALCYGEGEKPLLALLRAEDKAGFLESSPSWITKGKAAAGQAFQADPLEDLDEIPFLDFSIVDISDYRRNSILSTYPMAKGRERCMPMITSQGCTHRCCFCASHVVHGRKMRYHSLKRIKEDLRTCRDAYGARTIVFFDDHLMSSKKRFLDIMAALRELDLTAFFPSSLALYALDREVLEALKSVGVNQLVLSIESGSERVLREVMRKPLDLSIVKRVVADCRDLGISADANILIGLPGETKQDIEDTLAFLKTIGASWFRINIATPLVGSEMLATCIKSNYLRGDYLSCDYKRAIVETEDFTPEYIQEKVYSMNLELNFVCNGDFKRGDYDAALRGFENTLRVKSDHAFALHYAAKCCEKLGMKEKAAAFNAKYDELMESSEFWRNYAKEFKLPPFNEESVK